MESTEKVHEEASKQLDIVGAMFAVMDERETISKVDVQVVKEQVLKMIDAMNAEHGALHDVIQEQQARIDGIGGEEVSPDVTFKQVDDLQQAIENLGTFIAHTREKRGVVLPINAMMLAEAANQAVHLLVSEINRLDGHILDSELQTVKPLGMA